MVASRASRANGRSGACLLLFCILGLLLGCAWASAQQDGPRGLTLDEAIDIALQKHPSLAAADRAVDVSRVGYQEAEAIKSWQLQSTASGTYRGPLTTIEFPDPLTGQTRRMTFGQPFTTSIGISATKPLYVGRRERISRELARVGVESSELQRAQAEQQVIIGVKRAYYGLLKALRLRNVAEEAVSRAREHLRIAEARVDVGTAARLDAIQARVDLANAEHSLVLAETGVELARSALNDAMGLPLDTKTAIQEPGPVQFITVDPAQAEQAALKNRPEIAILDKAVEGAELRAKLERASKKASVLLQGGMQYLTGSPFVKGLSWQLGIVFSKPIGRQKAVDARALKAELQAEEARAKREVAICGIKLQIKQALTNLEHARDAIKVAQANIEQAREAYRVAQLAYKNGVGPRIAVKDAEVALTQAQTNLAQAIYDYQLAICELEYAIGVRSLGPLALPEGGAPGPELPAPDQAEGERQ